MQDVMILDARIEGWIAGWQLAAISLQGRVDVSEFINSFTSSHKFIFDYLLEEIFEGLPSELQDFLLKTSILERLSAPLCNAVMGKKNSHLIIDHLEQMNLFIIPMDDQRKWYRYHHLFGTLLVGRLKERFPDQISDLHLRASFWFGTNGEVWDSVRHAFSAGDVERVAQVAEVNVLAILERGELGILIRWLEEIPDEIIASYPWLRVAQAWALANAGLFDAAISCLLSAESFISDPSDLSQSEKSHVSGHFAAIRCYVTILTFGDYNKAVQLAQLALNELPNSDHRTRGMVTVYLGTLQRVRREFTPALDTLNSALAIYKSQGQTYVVIDILSQIARVRREQGMLCETVRVCDEALLLADGYSRVGQHRTPISAYVMGILGRIYYEWNRLDEALVIGTRALALSRKWGQANTLLGNHLFLGKIYQIQGRLDKALRSVLDAKETGSRFSEIHEFVIGAHEMIVRLEMGEVLAVEQWVLKDSKQFDVDPNERLWELAPLILPLYRKGALDLLYELSIGLDNLINIFNAGGVNRHAVNAYILKAVVLREQGEPDQALVSLGQALHLAEPERYIRSFLDQGAPMGALLKNAIAAGINALYANQLLAALQTDVFGAAAQRG